MFRGNWRIVIILLAIVVAGYYLYPTYKWYRLPAEEREKARLVSLYSLSPDNLTEEQLQQVLGLPDQKYYADLYALKERALTLGLDLQGGMHLVLEVDRTTTSTKGVESDIDEALTTIRNRIDQFGVREPIIQKQGDSRIVVQLPGLKDEQRAKSLLNRTAKLELRLLKDPERTSSLLEEIDYVLSKRQPESEIQDTTVAEPESGPDEETTLAEAETLKDEEEITQVSELNEEADAESVAAEGEEEMITDRPFTSLLGNLRGDIGVEADNRLSIEHLLADSAVQEVIPSDAEFLWSNVTEKIGDKEYYRLYLVDRDPAGKEIDPKGEGLTGKYIDDARPDLGSGMDPEVANKPIVNFSTDHDGATLLGKVSEKHVNERLAIVLDKKVFSAPVIESKLGKDSIIKGDFTMDEAKDLAIVLKAGALPASFDVIEERTVGPSLGRDSIRLAKISAAIGTGLILIFMIIYYTMSGAIANFALLLNIYFILAVLSGFHATLTLPGIAGIILTVGMAVDANVLIYERIREELRTGKTIRSAIDNGYARAFRTILDANVTTIITALVLYWQGTGPIKGFALTLIIGLLANMFTAVLVTRVIFDFVTTRWAIKKLSI